ncbi:MAG: hypothetical protein K8L97_26375, partial [Anaerolineae bacterium]|nr:hypothetical protein [Anaerolineae bacterium]
MYLLRDVAYRGGVIDGSSTWVNQSGAPQASLDCDANRLVLLDRLESDDRESGETFRSSEDQVMVAR